MARLPSAGPRRPAARVRRAPRSPTRRAPTRTTGHDPTRRGCRAPRRRSRGRHLPGHAATAATARTAASPQPSTNREKPPFRSPPLGPQPPRSAWFSPCLHRPSRTPPCPARPPPTEAAPRVAQFSGPADHFDPRIRHRLHGNNQTTQSQPVRTAAANSPAAVNSLIQSARRSAPIRSGSRHLDSALSAQRARRGRPCPSAGRHADARPRSGAGARSWTARRGRRPGRSGSPRPRHRAT